MKYVDEFRNPDLIKKWQDHIQSKITRRWSIMEICGGQTHNILKFGLNTLLPDSIELIHGPGCPVCVTPISMIDTAVEIALRPNTIVCSFGDMLRVPGTDISLLEARALGGDIRIVYSPRDVLTIAASNPTKDVVFFAVGFETTAPANAAAIVAARDDGLKNFSMIVSHVLVPPALRFILDAPSTIDGILAAGHVCTVTGYRNYDALAKTFNRPIIITGFEPLDILQGIYFCTERLESGNVAVINQYKRSVTLTGNLIAQRLLNEVFVICNREWRGLGIIPDSGFELSPAYHDFDALRRFAITSKSSSKKSLCLAGQVLQGKIKPTECPAFGTSCRPDQPLGAPMVSSEGACAAYFHYASHNSNTQRLQI